MITRIAHIGIAVHELANARTTFETLLGLKSTDSEVVNEQKVEISSFHIGDTNLELTSATSTDSPIAKFIGKRGEGVHHIAFEVDDLEAELMRLKKSGIALIDEQPRRGADNYLVAFIHPKSADGVLVELCQKRV